MLELRGLSAGYRGNAVLRELDLTVQAGELTALVGPNGCGKTTLLRLAAGLQKPEGGEILLEGRAMEDWRRRELARKVAFLPQSRTAPNLTVELLVQHGRFPHIGFSRQLTPLDRERVEYAMEVTHVAQWRGKLLGALSGGERQRVYVAMAVAQDTPLMLWDEPTTYLDMGHQFEILELAQTLNREGTTILMALHGLPEALSYAHGVCLLDGGAVRASGTPEEVFATGLLQEAFGVAARAVPLEEGRTGYCFYARRASRPG